MSTSLTNTRCRPVSKFTTFVDPEFVCSVGGGVLVDPVRAPCEHEFCRSCCADMTMCPVAGCRAVWDRNFVAAGKTARMTEKLSTRCDNGGCEWVGPWGKLVVHRAQECQCELVRCPNVGCQEPPMERRSLGAHRGAMCLCRTER